VRIFAGASSCPIDFWMRQPETNWSVRSRSPSAKLVGAQVAQLGGLHSIFSCAKTGRETFVRIGSFAAANFSASRASVSLTPSISNKTRPGLTTATPLIRRAPCPCPCGFSWGFLVIGLSGNNPHPDLAAAFDEPRHRHAGPASI